MSGYIGPKSADVPVGTISTKGTLSGNSLVVGTNNATIGNTIYVVSNGNVGIGNSSPQTVLDVSGTIRSTTTSPFFELVSGSTSTGGIYSGDTTSVNLLARSGKNLVFMSGGVAERMRIDTNGYVGIGTTTPSSYGLLSVLGNANDTTTSRIHIGNSNTGTGAIAMYTLGNDYSSGGAVAGLKIKSGAFTGAVNEYEIFNNIGPVNITSGGTSAIYIPYAGGRVGIGTTNPSSKFHVYSNSGDSSLFQGNSANSTGLYIQNDNSGTYGTIYSYGNTGYGVTSWANSFVIESVPATGGNLVLDAYTGSMIFQTGRNNRMIINSSGNVAIGNSSPIAKLHVEGEVFTGRVDSSTEGGQIGFGRSSDNARLYAIDCYGSGTNPELRMFNDLGGIVFFSASNTGVNYIKFNPTQTAISDGNALDDYEEGTWSPTFSFDSGSASQTVVSAKYVKIGKVVILNFRVNFSSASTATNPRITNLPFAVSDGAADSSGVIREYNLTGLFWGLNFGSSTTVYMNRYDNNNVIPNNGPGFSGTFTYLTST